MQINKRSTLSLGTLLMVLSGRRTRSTLSDFIVLKFLPAPLFLQHTSRIHSHRYALHSYYISIKR